MNLTVKPSCADFPALPELDFTNRLDNMVSIAGSFEELLHGYASPKVREMMGEVILNEIFVRAYNYTAMMFSGHESVVRVCIIYADVIKNRFIEAADVGSVT